MLRIPHSVGNQLTDGAKAVSYTHRPRCTPQKHFSVSSARFCYRLSKLQGLVWLEGSGELGKKINSPHWLSNRDLLSYCTVAQPLRYCVQ
jgi:hypothetical protein